MRGMRGRQVDPVELLLNRNEAGVLRMNEDLRKRCINRQNIFFWVLRFVQLPQVLNFLQCGLPLHALHVTSSYLL